MFSGIGGLELGLERAGFKVSFQVEINEYARKVLVKHWPDVPRFHDIREVGKHNLPRVDLLCGGFPCQDLSYAGKGKGLAGERSGLWREYRRLIEELSPSWVLIENVPALRSRGLGRVLQDLASLGLDAEWDCLPASAFGAPHQRDRLFIVAYPIGSRVEGLLQSGSPSKAGSWGWGGQEDLRALVDAPFQPGNRWPAPLFRRVADGVPSRVDRLKCLGNAVVPTIAEYIGRRILSTQ